MMISFLTREVTEMKNQLFIAMMVMASLLFIAAGAGAQYCLTCGPQGAAGVWWQQHHKELAPTTSYKQERAQEFMPAVPGTREGREEMAAAGAAGMRGLNDARENAGQFTTGRALCGYCSLFERAGFP
jgi:hypothetical protein